MPDKSNGDERNLIKLLPTRVDITIDITIHDSVYQIQKIHEAFCMLCVRDRITKQQNPINFFTKKWSAF